MKIIVTGHAQFASGMISALNLITGNPYHFLGLDFTGDDDGSQLLQQINEVAQQEETLVLCDLYGGTPFRMAIMLAMENSNIKVMAGINLGLLLSLSTMELTTLDNLQNLEEIACEHVYTYKQQQKTDEEWTD